AVSAFLLATSCKQDAPTTGSGGSNIGTSPDPKATPAAPAAKPAPTPTATPPGTPPAAPSASVTAPKGPAPERVKVAHVLIAFLGAERSTATRSKADAEKLANEIFARAKKGEDFDTLMKQSNDPGGGKYGLYTTPQSMKPGDFPKNGMAKGFADLSFSLQVGEVGMCALNAAPSPFGWHIIKRIE